jgi:hypothetical protein
MTRRGSATPADSPTQQLSGHTRPERKQEALWCKVLKHTGHSSRNLKGALLSEPEGSGPPGRFIASPVQSTGRNLQVLSSFAAAHPR